MRYSHLIFYDDDFGWLGTGKAKKKQTNFMVTCAELPAMARKNEKDLGSITFMLCPTYFIHNHGRNILLEYYLLQLYQAQHRNTEEGRKLAEVLPKTSV